MVPTREDATWFRQRTVRAASASPGVRWRRPRFLFAERNSHMADWRKTALAAILADGKIDDTEVRLLRKELWEDGQIDPDEVKFLIDLRNLAQKKAKGKVSEGFEKLFFKAITENVLKDGRIDAAEA